ncbi:DUF3772 domain-containing protein [Alsobacter sp. R-9]
MPPAPLRRWPVVVLLAALCAAAAGWWPASVAPASAQQQPASATATAPVQPSGSSNAVQVRQNLDAVRIQLDQLEAGLQRRGSSDQALQALRASVDPLATQARSVVVDLAPRAEAIRLRLKELGPKPGEKDPPEGADVTKEREDRQAALAEIDETIRIARSLLVQAEQIEKEIADLRRSLFTSRLFESSASLLSPTLWMEIGKGLPGDIKAFWFLAAQTWDRALERLTPRGAIAVFAALALAAFLILPLRRFGVAFVKRDRLAGQPNRLQKAIAAAGLVLISALLPVSAAYVVYSFIDSIDLLPPRVEPIFGALAYGMAFVAFASGLADALLAPDRSNWRLFGLSDDKAQRLVRVLTAVAVVLALGRFSETVLQAIAASLKLSVALKGLFAVLAALIFSRALPLIQTVSPSDEAAFGPHVTEGVDYSGIVRGVGWGVVTVVTASAAVGYVALASFLADQFTWAGIVIAITLLLVILAGEGITAAFASRGPVSRVVRSSIGLSGQSIEQLGVLASGVSRVVIIGLAVLFLLAPWGVESRDVLSSLQAAFFGITIGGVTLSMSTIVLAFVFFGIGVFATRAVQRWLQKEYLPRTKMDAGLRNSITTGVGYAGIVGAGAIAVSYLGLSFDKLTIVAGALSLGIGFGLQSIVNNFVSGLILLAERGVKVGDWIVVGDEQGYVKKINVRATQIETFDRATLIVPNSNLVSGTVKNWVHTDRVGRIIVTIPVARDTDADMVATLMRAAAQENPDVLEDPAPRVLFKRITETSLTFDLVCFVAEVDTGARVSSDLTFAIVRRLRENGIIKPAGPAKFELDGMLDLREEVAHIRAALDTQAARRVADEDPDFHPVKGTR